MGVQEECQKFEKKLRIVCIFDLMTKIEAQNVKFVENTLCSLSILMQYNWFNTIGAMQLVKSNWCWSIAYV